ncbi:MAG TPA: hypothetical protein VGQ57_09655 [Polyangiaceae bacterium]|jgi:hypothetical protein|nr:hypothetical protein [Polyangiaceae bacterium]
MGLRVGCAIGAALATIAFARPSSAQLVYYNPNPTPVDVWLGSPLPNATLQIYQGHQRPGHVAPTVACYGQCAFKLVPGEYRVLIDGPEGSDVHRSFRNFELSGSSQITVEPPSASAHYGGLALGIVGPIAIMVGSGLLLAGGLNGSAHSDGRTAGAAALILGGVGVTVGGWVLFAANRRPSVEITPLPQR